MKKIIFFLLLVISIFGTCYQANAFTIDDETNKNLNIISSTQQFDLDLEFDNLIYDKNKLYSTDLKHFIIIDPSPTRLILDPDTNLVIIDLNFVSPQASELSLTLINDTYYVYYAGERLYGDFNFLVDGKEVIANNVKGLDVKLSYEGSIISNIVEPKRGIITEYIVLFVGAALLLLILGYLIYLFIPKNYYKKMAKTAKGIITFFNKDKSLKQNILSLKIKLGNLTIQFRAISPNDPKYKDLKSALNEMNLTLENIIKLASFYKEEDLNGLKDYFTVKAHNFIQLLDNGNYSFKDHDKHKFKTELLKPNVMNKEQEDALHYLEGIDVINKNKN